MNVSEEYFIFDAQLFNKYEKWGIFIAFLCFTAGFPSNLISIIVCFKSLLPPRRTSRRRFQSTKLYEMLKQIAPNLSIKDKATTSTRITDNEDNFMRHGKLTSFNKIINPHRKCFEIYLIEISICDLIILSYSFIEWLLLVLSRYNLIDKIYSEPVLISKFMCRFLLAFNRTVFVIHNWLVALLAVTRCYAIYKPFALISSKFYCHLNLYTLVTLLIIFITGNIFGASIFDLKQTGYNRSECKIKDYLEEKYENIAVYQNLIIGVIGYSLPVITTLLINLALIVNIRYLLFNKKEILRRNTHSNKGIENTQNLNRIKFLKTSSSLLLISFSYLICYIPFTTLYMLLSLDKLDMNRDLNRRLVFAFTKLRYLNHTLNFFLYYATAKRFRNDINSFFSLKGGA